MSKDWDDEIMLHDWPEMGPGRLSLDDLYEMFKKRLAREYELKRRVPHLEHDPR